MASFGSALRRTREEKGISLDDIAGETRLSKRYLLALEDEAIHKLPGGTYNRAYLRTYAGYLGLDIEGLVRQYSLEEAHQTEIGKLQKQPDVLTSIGKVVESRQGSTGGRGWSWKWTDPRAGRIAAFAGLGSLAVLLLAVGLWLGVGPGGGSAVATVPAADERAPADAPGRPDQVAALPSEEVPQPARTVEPPPAPAAAPAPAAEPPAPVAPAPIAPKPAAPPPEKAVAAAPRAAVPAPAPAPAPGRGRGAARTSVAGRLSVSSSGVGTNVVDRRLVGQSDTFVVGTRVTFWTRIAGGRAGDTVNHVWFHNGTRIGTTSLRVGSADWRTQSRQLLIPDGQWAVEARDADGRVLAQHTFRSTPK